MILTTSFPETRCSPKRGGADVPARELVKNAIHHLLPRFTVGELERVCKRISRKTLVRALRDLRAQGAVRCLGRGPNAQWERIGR